MRKGFLGLVWVLLVFFQQSCFSFSDSLPCEATKERPCIVQDTADASEAVVRLRDMPMIKEFYHGNTAGVDGLHMSGSSEPSQDGWQQVANYIREKTGREPQQVLVLDLRQENHGYLNGNAITLCDLYNWLNLGQTASETLLTEASWLAALAKLANVDHVLTSQQFSKKDYSLGSSVTVEKLASEKEITAALGFAYYRIAVTDHRGPVDEAVDSFVNLIDQLPESSWVHVHCRAGKGRTATFLALYDMLKNADKASFNDIIARQAAIPPFYDLSQIIRAEPELTAFYQERLIFLNYFYQFAQEKLAGFEGSWSQWKREHQLH